VPRDRVESEQPASRRIAEELRLLIYSGALAEGDRLPSERHLAAEHQTARNTAREAVRLLADEGLVTAEHGRGVFVRRSAPVLRFGADRYDSAHRTSGTGPFAAEVERQGLRPGFEVLSVARAVPARAIADALGVDGGRKSVFERRNRHFADDEPVQLVTTWLAISVAQASRLTRRDPGAGGIYARLEDAGHVLTRYTEQVSARMPRREEVEALELPPGVPVLDLLHVGFDQHAEAFEATRFVVRADRGALAYDLEPG